MQLVSDGFVETVESTLREFGLERGSVCLEITESVVVQDIETTGITLAALKQVGVALAIDATSAPATACSRTSRRFRSIY